MPPESTKLPEAPLSNKMDRICSDRRSRQVSFISGVGRHELCPRLLLTQGLLFATITQVHQRSLLARGDVFARICQFQHFPYCTNGSGRFAQCEDHVTTALLNQRGSSCKLHLSHQGSCLLFKVAPAGTGVCQEGVFNGAAWQKIVVQVC